MMYDLKANYSLWSLTHPVTLMLVLLCDVIYTKENSFSSVLSLKYKREGIVFSQG